MTPLFETVVALAKGTDQLVHENTLQSAEVHILRAANGALCKRRRAKTIRVCQRDALSLEDAQDIVTHMEAEEQVRRDLQERAIGKRVTHL